MQLDQLTELAAEIRQFLVSVLSRTGGHLGPNLGVVELTLALHRVVDSPADTILWDTGHQAYVHKIVTGRSGDFPTLRQPGGLSGYPKRAESPHDHIENSHASTALSYACGLARSRQLRGDGRRVVVVVGDGALTGGLAYEALANLGMAALDVVVVVNDNGRSYAPTVSRLTTADGAPGDPRGFFTSLGLSYLGPVDGHDLQALEGALSAATSTGGPVVLHVHTKKGQGYPQALADAEKCLHDVGPFEVSSGRPVRAGARGSSFTEAFGRAVVAQAQARPELVAITAAMPGSTGLLEMAGRFPDRFFDVGIAEQHAVASAAGMAMGGLRPVVALYSTFLNRAWDQIVYDVALHRLPVVFCIDRAGITGDDGPSHHGIFDLSLLAKVPWMRVLAPSCAEEVGGMVSAALDRTDGPTAIRWPKTPSPPPAGGVVPSAASAWRARRVRAGSDLCLLGVGPLVQACLEAADLLALHEVQAAVWDVRVAAPLDPEMLASLQRYPVVVVAEDGVVQGGVGQSVAASLGAGAQEGAGAAHPWGGPVTVVPCGLPVAFVPQGRPAEILSALGLDGPGLARRALGALRATGRRDALPAAARRYAGSTSGPAAHRLPV